MFSLAGGSHGAALARSDQFDLALILKALGQRGAVEGLIADQFRREFVDERFVEGLLDENDIVA